MPNPYDKPFLGLDPGGTTGIAIFYEAAWNNMYAGSSNRNVSPFEMKELGPEDHHVQLYKFLTNSEWQGIICESFEFRQPPPGVTAGQWGLNLISREYIGIVRLYCELTKTPLIMQTAGQMKGSAFKPRPVSESDRDPLKRLELYNAPGGRQHMNDALRHLLLYLTTKGGRPHLISGLRPNR